MDTVNGARSRTRPVAPLLWAVGAALTATGCDSGPATTRIWGRVSYDNQPIEYGSIVLTPIEPDSGRTVGATVHDGQYEIRREDGPIVGQTYRVEITGLKEMDAVETPHGAMMRRRNYIPAAFNVESQLRVTIAQQDAKNEHDFHLPKEL